jgi:hypothetical protein
MPNDWLNDQRHIPLDYPVHDVHLRLQRQVLHMFFDPHRLARIIDNGLLSHESLTLAELFETVRSHLWSELDLPTPRINSFRRNAQRAHLDMLTSLVMDEKVDYRTGVTRRVRFRGMHVHWPGTSSSDCPIRRVCRWRGPGHSTTKRGRICRT